MNAKEKKRHCAELITKHYVKPILKLLPNFLEDGKGPPQRSGLKP